MASVFSGSRVVVTGGLGFIGSSIARRLSSEGADVLVYDARLDPYGWNDFNLEGAEGKIAVVQGDVRDRAATEAAVAGADFVFHCAAQMSHVDSMKDPFLDVDINCNGTLSVLEAVRRNADGAKLVYAGTRGQVGKAVAPPVDESHPTDPTDVYGVDKLAGEKYCLAYGAAYGLKACSIRLTNTFGPRHQMRHNYGILNWFVRLALEGRELPVYGDGSQLRDYLFVDDAVDAFARAAASPASVGSVYHVGSDSPVRFADMAGKVAGLAKTGSRVRHVPWPEESRRIETGDFVFNSGKARRELGWKPVVKFDDGLGLTVDYYRMHLGKYV